MNSAKVRLLFLEAREKLEASEKQATASKHECRLIIVKGHEKEDRFEAELASMRTEVSTMTKEIVELRASASARPEPDPMMTIRCTTIEKERDELRTMLKKSEDQLDTVRRVVVALTMKASAMDPERFMLKSDQSELLKKREAELLSDMKVQLLKGHVDMRRHIVEAVEAAVSHQKAEIVRLEGDCRHFSSSLADVMNEVNTLRNKYEDWEEWEDAKEDDFGEGEDGDHLSGWYRADMGNCEAAGVGLDYSERVRRAVAPLTGPLTGRVEEAEAQDLVAAAKKAALAAALATTEASHHTKAYAKLSAPSFPKGGEMTNRIYSLGTGVVAVGFYGDELEVTWIRECWSKSCDQLGSSDLDGAKDQIRWKRLDFSLSRELQGMVKSSAESLSEDVTLK